MNKDLSGLEVIRHTNLAISCVADAWCRGLDYKWYLDICKFKEVTPLNEETFNKFYTACQEDYERDCETTHTQTKASELFF